MIKFFLILIFVFPSIYSIAQQSIVNGVVSIHNSKYETGREIFVPNAEIKDSLRKERATTDGNGRFSLAYIGLEDHKTVSFTVKKDGLDVVNIDKLTAITGQEEVVKISMAKPGQVLQYRDKLYRVGKQNAEKFLKDSIKRVKDELAKEKRLTKTISEKMVSLQRRLVDLEVKLKDADSMASIFAQKYSLVNLDDYNEDFGKAYDLMTRGDLKLALNTLNTSKIDSAISVLNLSQKEISERRQNLKGQLYFKLDIFRLTHEYDSVSSMYERIFLLDSNDINGRLEYAAFLSETNNYLKSLNIYQSIDKLAATSLQRARAYSSIGHILVKNGDYNSARIYLEKAISDLNFLKMSAQGSERSLALAKVNLGFVYSFQKSKYEQAIIYLNEVVGYVDSLPNIEYWTLELKAKALHHLAIINDYSNNITSADSLFKASYDILRVFSIDDIRHNKTYLNVMRDYILFCILRNNIRQADVILKGFEEFLLPLYNQYGVYYDEYFKILEKLKKKDIKMFLNN